MPKRKRDYAAEYRARKAREAERGFSSPSSAQRARQAGKAPAVRQGRRQVYRKGDQGTVTTTAAGRGLGVVARTLDTLDPDTPVTVYADVTVAEGGGLGVRQMTVTSLTAGDLQGADPDELAGAIADAVTDGVTKSGKAHHAPGALVQAFEAGDVERFQVAW